MGRGRLLSGGALWPCVILRHAIMAFLSLKPKATLWTATCLQQRAIFKVAGFCLQGPWCIVRTSSIDAWIVATQHKNILLSGSDEGNCVTAHHACEGWHFQRDVGTYSHMLELLYTSSVQMHIDKGLIHWEMLLYCFTWETGNSLLAQRKPKKCLLSYNFMV